MLEKADHPYIIKLVYAFQTDKKLYMALEYCPGGEIFFHLQRAGRFNENVAKFYSACCVLAIEYLHYNRVIYRDLKPENVLIDSEGYAKIADFGLSKEHLLGLETTNSFCGTPEYLAPEILERNGHSKAVD